VHASFVDSNDGEALSPQPIAAIQL